MFISWKNYGFFKFVWAILIRMFLFFMTLNDPNIGPSFFMNDTIVYEKIRSFSKSSTIHKTMPISNCKHRITKSTEPTYEPILSNLFNIDAAFRLQNRILHSTVYSVQCTVYSVQCTLYPSSDINVKNWGWTWSGN